ncbi:sugar ABC transporter permease [Arthrobacter sp. D1-29]
MTTVEQTVPAPAAAPERGGTPPKPRARPSSMRRKEARFFWLFISPWIVGFMVFLLGPMLASVYLSFTDWDSFTDPNWVGFANYARLLTEDEVFHKSLWNTFYFAFFSVPLGMAIALWLAALLNKKVRARKVFRTLVYLPHLVPIVAVALIFQMVLAPDAGPLNKFLAVFGVDGPAWLFDSDWVKPAIILLSLWQAGGATVLLLAGMKGIPQEFYEAAEIDGASSRRQFWSITFPQLTPIIFFNLIMGIIGAFQVFAQVYILTQGGPDNASQMVVPLLFTEAFRNYRMGYASAISWVLFLIVMALTVLAFATARKWVFYETEVKN